jgi:VWFA-related protein
MRRILVFVCAAGMIAAQDPELPSIGKITTRVVLAPVTVVGRDGLFVPGLTPYDFRLYDNGKLQTITEDVGTHPLSLVVVVQANADVEKILPAIQKLSSIFESLVIGEDGEMAVIAFDHRIQVLTDFTSEPAKIDTAFSKIHAGGYVSALNDATMRAINMLKTRPSNRRRVVVQIAENRDKGSEIKSVREVLTEAEFNNIVFYPINISQLVAALTSKAQPNRPSTIPPGGQNLPMGQISTGTTDMQMEMGNWVPALKDIFDAAKGIFVPDPLDVYAKYTGGREFAFKSDKALQRDVQQIGDELHSQYLLSYNPNNKEEGGFHQIRVMVMKADLKAVRVRDGYWLAAEPK